MTFVGTGIYVVAGIVYVIIYLIHKLFQFIKRKKKGDDNGKGL